MVSWPWRRRANSVPAATPDDPAIGHSPTRHLFRRQHQPSPPCSTRGARWRLSQQPQARPAGIRVAIENLHLDDVPSLAVWYVRGRVFHLAGFFTERWPAAAHKHYL